MTTTIEPKLHTAISALNGRVTPAGDRLRAQARNAFPCSCGWQYHGQGGPELFIAQRGSQREVALRQEFRYPEIDHCGIFTFPKRLTPRCCVSHSYLGAGALSRIKAMVEPYGLAAVELVWSWYYPEACTAVAIFPPGAVIPSSPWFRCTDGGNPK